MPNSWPRARCCLALLTMSTQCLGHPWSAISFVCTRSSQMQYILTMISPNLQGFQYINTQISPNFIEFGNITCSSCPFLSFWALLDLFLAYVFPTVSISSVIFPPNPTAHSIPSYPLRQCFFWDIVWASIFHAPSQAGTPSLVLHSSSVQFGASFSQSLFFESYMSYCLCIDAILVPPQR